MLRGRKSTKGRSTLLPLVLLLWLLLLERAPAAQPPQLPDACLTDLDDDALRDALANGNLICGAKPHTLELPPDGLAPFDGFRLAPPASDAAARRTEGIIFRNRENYYCPSSTT